MRAMVELLAGGALLVDVSANAQSCNFPARYSKRHDAEYEQRPAGPPIRIAANVRMVPVPPKLIRPQIDTTVHVTPSEDDEELVSVRADVIVDGALFQQELPTAFTSSSTWQAFTAGSSDCDKRIDPPNILLSGYSERSIDLRLDVVVHKRWCTPIGNGDYFAGHIVGPIHFFQLQITDPDDGEVFHDFRSLEVTAGPFSIVTSGSQDFFYNLLQATPLGIQAGMAGLHYENLKANASAVINAHISGQRYDVTKDFLKMLGEAEGPFPIAGQTRDITTGQVIPSLQLADVQFVRGPTGNLAFKLSYQWIDEWRSGETCSLLRRNGF